MTYSTLDEGRRLIIEIMATGTDTVSGMRQILDRCRQSHPTGIGHLEELDIGTDLQALRTWLLTVLRVEPPSSNIASLWFGLYIPERDNERQGYDLYVAGTDSFDPVDTTGDWLGDPSYWPKHRYAHSRVLRALSALKVDVATPTTSIARYILPLAYACLSVRETIQSIEPALLCGNRLSRGLVVGFDEGDYIVLGTIDMGGLQSSSHQ